MMFRKITLISKLLNWTFWYSKIFFYVCSKKIMLLLALKLLRKYQTYVSIGVNSSVRLIRIGFGDPRPAPGLTHSRWGQVPCSKNGKIVQKQIFIRHYDLLEKQKSLHHYGLYQLNVTFFWTPVMPVVKYVAH